MGDPGLTAETAFQVNQTLLYSLAVILFILGCLAVLTALVFVWRECFSSPSRQARTLSEDHSPHSGLLPLVRIVLTPASDAHRPQPTASDSGDS